MKLNVETALDMHWHGDYTSAAQFFDVSLGTIYRWRRENKLPFWALTLLQGKRSNSLRQHGKLWDGWKINERDIVTPNGHRISIEQLIAYGEWIDSNRVIDDNAKRFMLNKLIPEKYRYMRMTGNQK